MSAKEKPVSKPATDAYRDNWDAIFGIKPLPHNPVDQCIFDLIADTERQVEQYTGIKKGEEV